MSRNVQNKPKPKKGSNQQKSKKKTQTTQFNVVSVPVALAQKQQTKQPRIDQSRDGTHVRIRHRELLFTLINSVDFTVRQTVPLQPAQQSFAPWLSRQAICWEKYKFHSIMFEAITRCGTGQAGSVILAPDYDAADIAPIDEPTACAYRDTVEDAPWKNIQLRLNKASLGGIRYTRAGALVANLDIKTYDAGNVFIAVTGGDNNTDRLSKIWVSYDVEFFIPQLPSRPTEITGGSYNSAGTPSFANPMGSAPVANANNNGISIDSNSNITIRDAGSYLSTVNTYATGLTSAGVLTNVFGAPSIANFGNVSSTGTSGILKSEITTSVPNTVLNLNSILGGAFTGAHWDVARMPGGSA